LLDQAVGAERHPNAERMAMRLAVVPFIRNFGLDEFRAIAFVIHG
jgi:hypothetical protein